MAGSRSLAESLRDSPTEDTRQAARGLTVLLGSDRDDAAVARFVPPDSRVLVLANEGPRSDRSGRRGRAAARALESLEDVRDAVHDTANDILLVSDIELLAGGTCAALRRALASDSACATVSVDDRAPSWISGVPPAGAVEPVPGAILVSRNHLLLALDEVELVARADIALVDGPEAGSLTGMVLASLDRPGFIHRVVPRRGPVPPPSVPVRAVTVGPATIALDGRCLAEPLSGTQVQLLGLLGGLLRAGADVAVVRPAAFHPTCDREVARFQRDVPFVEHSRLGRVSVFHRTSQLGSLHELALCLSLGDRLVLTHQDMIRDRTRAYTRRLDSWHDYRRTTTAALASADEVGFFTRHAALDAASDGGVDLDRATVVKLGVDHLSNAADDRDPLSPPLGGRPYLLVVGNSFWHKNRLFAIRLVRHLIERHAWDGGLVLAGGTPGIGSSNAAETVLLEAAPRLRERVVDLGYVSASEQCALYRGAEAVLFPSLYEGFGLVPFEAAVFGTACAYAHVSAMRELLPDDGALPSFDVEEAGSFVFDLLENPVARERVVAGIREAASELTWDRTAAGYLDVYARSLARDPRPVSRALATLGTGRVELTSRESLLLDVYRRRRGVRLAIDGGLSLGASVLATIRLVRTTTRGDGGH